MVEYNCRDCGKSNDFENDDFSVDITCSFCGRKHGPASGFIDPEKGVLSCGICGCRELYIQKDFSRKVGCAIAAAGALLAPFTWMISLAVAALIDLILYLALPLITVCYRCGAIYRELPINPDFESFNLGINDRYRQDGRMKDEG